MPKRYKWKTLDEVSAQLHLKVQIAKDPMKSGFKFCGPTIVYALIQVNDMVSDRQINCLSYNILGIGLLYP